MQMVDVGYDSTHYYVLSAEGRPKLLIDVGWPGTLVKMHHQCKRAGITLEQIGHFICTHYHPDHAGLAVELMGLGCRLIVVDLQQSAVPLLPSLLKPEQRTGTIDLKAALITTIADSRALLARIGVQGQIVATPGHSDDSVTVVLDSGEAFTGDLPPPMMGDETTAPILQASWTRIRASGGKTLYPAHGPFPRPIADIFR